MKIARIATIPYSFIHWQKQFEYFSTHKMDVTLITGKNEHEEFLDELHGLRRIVIDLPREISPLRDIQALIVLFLLFRKEKFDLVHSITPKGGLLVSIAAFLARVPVRIHTFTGQRWITLHGPMKMILKTCDQIIGLLSTRLYSDSPSQTEFLISNGLVSRKKIFTIHKGSLGGIDFEQFSKNKYPPACLNFISSNSLKLLYLGRINKDKGICELVTALSELLLENKDIELILAGPFEPHLDPLPEDIIHFIKTNPRIHATGFVNQPQKYFAIADVFCLPSYREGFGTVVLEAAAFCLPTIGTKITGLVDAVEDGKTGILVESRSVDQLKSAINSFYEDRKLIKSMGEEAYLRARRDFSCDMITHKQLEDYQNLLASKIC